MDRGRAVPDAHLYGMRVNFRPMPRLEIGLSRTAQLCGDGRNCGLDTLIDSFLGRDNQGENIDPSREPGNQLGLLQEALELAGEVAPLEKRLRQARKEGLIVSEYIGEQIEDAEKAQVISKAEARGLRDYNDKVLALLAVDDFTTDQLARVTPEKAAKTRRKKASKKKTPGKKSTAVKRVASKKVSSKQKSEAS